MRNDTTHLNNELEAICLQYESLPMRALWEALQIKSFGGAKVISAFMQKCRCGLEQRATKPEGEMVASCGFKLGVKNCGATPLSIACLAGRHEVMKYLIDCGASVYAKELDHGVNPLHVAVFCNDERAIRLLVDAGGSSITLEKDNLGRSGVHVAAMMGLTEVLKLLISEGCDVNSEDRSLMLPIHYAASKNCVAAIRLLIECGSTLDAYCNFKWTPLYIAAKNGHVEAIELLAAKGADVNALDKELRNPLFAVLLYVSHMPTIMATLQTLLRLGSQEVRMPNPLSYFWRMARTPVQLTDMVMRFCTPRATVGC